MRCLIMRWILFVKGADSFAPEEELNFIDTIQSITTADFRIIDNEGIFFPMTMAIEILYLFFFS